MPTLVDAQEEVRKLSVKMYEITGDDKLTAAEQKDALDKYEPELATWMKEVKNLQHVENRRKELLSAIPGVDPASDTNNGPTRGWSIGKQFVEASGYKSLLQNGLKGSRWTTGDIELKAAPGMSEGTADDPGPGYALVSQPQVLPGIVDIKLPELTVADLFPQSGTSSVLVRYLIETMLTNAAAGVPEGELIPASAIKFDKADETLKNIKTFMPVTNEMLEDYEQIMGYINNRLTMFIKQNEQVQLLSGDGEGENITGILNRSGLAASIVKGAGLSDADDNSMDAIYRQITQIRMTAFLEPDSIVTDPLAWQGITLSKNSQGAYYANGPFQSQTPPTVWGKKVVPTPAMPTNEALVGAFAQGAQIFRKGGVVVEASNSHADWFQRDMTAIRAVERLLLAVYRPGAFGTVTNL